MVHARLTGIKQTITKEWNKLWNVHLRNETKEEIWKTTASLTGLSTKKGRKLARLILICFTAKEISADDLDNGKHERDIKEKKNLGNMRSMTRYSFLAHIHLFQYLSLIKNIRIWMTEK